MLYNITVINVNHTYICQNKLIKYKVATGIIIIEYIYNCTFHDICISRKYEKCFLVENLLHTSFKMSPKKQYSYLHFEIILLR